MQYKNAPITKTCTPTKLHNWLLEFFSSIYHKITNLMKLANCCKHHRIMQYDSVCLMNHLNLIVMHLPTSFFTFLWVTTLVWCDKNDAVLQH